MIYWNNIDNKMMIRQDRMFHINRNGDFVDVFWKRNGKWMRISILERDLKTLLAMDGDGVGCDALISFDEDVE